MRNSIISFLYKLVATLLIWFIAFFPFSWLGITEIANIPAKNAEKQVILQFKKEISNSETFADLTPFGLGIYKLRNKGDKYLWDITKPEANVITYDGVEMGILDPKVVDKLRELPGQKLSRKELAKKLNKTM